MGSWYNFLVKIKPDGKAFRSILYSKILYEVIASAIEIVRDYAIYNINDQVWYVNSNFNPIQWESRYQITVPNLSTLDERRQVVKFYMLFPQYQNRLSLDYFQISLDLAGYTGITVSYNTLGGDSESSIRMTTVIETSGDKSISIPFGGYSDTNYDFSFKAYDSGGYEVFPTFVSKSATNVTLNLPQQCIVTLSTIRTTSTESFRITTSIESSGIQEVVIANGGYVDDVFDFEFQAYDADGYYVPIIFISKSLSGVTFDLPQDCTVILSTFKSIVDDSLRMITSSLSLGVNIISIPYSGYVDDNYDFDYQAYDSDGYEVFPIFVSKSATSVTLDLPENCTVVLKTLRVVDVAEEDSFLHANDYGDEKAEFQIGTLTYNSFIVSGITTESLYKNIISLLMSLKPPQVVLYDKIEVLQAIALDDNLAIALDDNLAIALTTL